ncbi:mannosylglycerate hydrolase [Virgibacillus halotolerans]|uniref:glycoside hydrolase family 38 N-terminal domain-containing protein n=1 Tax=Virgibacillus halotolerans TaxID=1071053 RepID=UPI001961330F|nr:glycoside hydrolase family 38 C-terminal domain-containing protein [Virgibacillus halotolerans]MBM7598913.1 mannosylglycerate hydrolase [Virgibacillus halotolerans]
MTNKIHVIAHTHWDYEWYFTSSESFIQLCYHVDEVIKALEEEVLDYYMLDGQMSIIEDYLEVHPENRSRIKDLVEKGKLKIGPWYTQSDQMIIRGESLVRNLQIGMELGDLLGGADRLGYIPDAFGQSIDMPKIFSQMGINRSVFWRGLSSDKMKQREFFWESEDGSRVMAYNIKDGYFVGVQLIETNDSEALMKQIKQDTTSSHIALPVGGDQRFVDFNLKGRIDDYNQRLTEEVLIESNYDQLFEAINEEKHELPTVQGELLNAEVSKIHRSIYSSRYDHKYLNDKVERRLIYQVEPLIAIADHLNIPFKRNLLDKIWKIILRNHAHDSAGACNSDKTNQDILQRLIEADQLSYSIVDYLTRKISESREAIAPNQVTVFNTLPIEREQMIKLNISLVQPVFAIYHKGEKVPYQIISSEKRSNDPIRKEIPPAEDSFYIETEILLPLKLDALGYEVLDVIEGENGEAFQSNEQYIDKRNEGCIENKFYQIIYDGGQIHVLDKVSDTLYKDFLYVEDAGDDGDNYDYSPPIHDWKLKLDFIDADVVRTVGEFEEKMRISGTFKIPLNQSERVKGNANCDIAYVCTIRILPDSQAIDVHINIENDAFDHRMRLILNGDVKTEQSIADTPFGTIARPKIDPNLGFWKKNGWKEEPSGIYPMLNFVNLHDEQKSISAFSKGVKEYEVIGTDTANIALTLFRAVGYLGKPDLVRRPGVASGNQFRYIKSPDSQLQKQLTFKFSIVIGKRFSEVDAFRHYQKYAITVPYYQQQSLNQFTTTLKYFVMQPLPEKLPNQFSLLDASEVKHVVYSSFTKSRDGKGFVIRFFNPTDQVVGEPGKVNCHGRIQTWKFVTMAEQLDRIGDNDDGIIELGVFKPKEVKTIYMEF